MRKRKFILAKWTGKEGSRHSGVYFLKDKPMLKKTLKKWKRQGKISKFSIKKRKNFF